MQVEQWPIERLTPYARNPRKNAHAVEDMAQAIRAFGFRVPVLARSTGEVVDGHLRLKAAIVAGLAEVPVILCDDMTPEQVKAFRISVNRMADLADWDEGLLKLEMLDLKALDFDLELTGFDNKELDLLFLENDDLGNIPEAGSGKEKDDLTTCPKCGYRHAKN